MDTTLKPTDLELITEALDLSELPVEEQEEILVDIQDLVFQGTMVRLFERMTEEDREEFSVLIDSDPSEDDLNTFIYSRVPEADELVQETIADFADDILAVTKE